MTVPFNNDYEYTTLKEFGMVSKDSEGVSDYLMKRRTVREMEELYDIYEDDLAFSAITITFKPFIQNNLDELQMRHAIYIALHECNVEKYILYPDTIHGKFHYHGIIKHPVRLQHKLKLYFNRNIGFINIKYLSDTRFWYDYMRKDKGFRSKEHPIELLEPIYPDKLIELYSLSK